MDRLLILQLIISFIAGGVFVALQTIVAERTAPTLRRIILTIPSTMALGLLFLGLAKTPADAANAATIIPATLIGSYIYIVMYAFIAQRYSIPISVIASLLIWIIFAGALQAYPPADFWSAAGFYFIPAIFVLYFFINRLPHKEHAVSVAITPHQIAARAVFAGILIVLTVLSGKIFGNEWGALFATYPAAFTTMLVTYHFLYGRRFIATIVHDLFFPGSFGFVLYAFIVMFLFPHYGIWWGTLGAYGATFAFFGAYFSMRH